VSYPLVPEPSDDGVHLRLVWPQWQGAGSTSVRGLAGDLPAEVVRTGYAVGTAVLDAVLPAHRGPTAHVPVAPHQGPLALPVVDGVEGKEAVLAQLGAAQALLVEHTPDRVTTLGGDCAVSVVPFAHLAARHDDLAVVWVDSHPDTDTGETGYDGFHAMAVSALTGHGDPDVVAALPATVPAARVALVGVHSWQDDAWANVARWGLTSFAPDELRTDSEPLVAWLRGTGCTRVAVHFDVDTVDSDEVRLGLGADVGGLTGAQARRVVRDVAAAADVVGLTIAEFVPRQVLHLQRVLVGFPLLEDGQQHRQ
jgi:arginase